MVSGDPPTPVKLDAEAAASGIWGPRRGAVGVGRDEALFAVDLSRLSESEPWEGLEQSAALVVRDLVAGLSASEAARLATPWPAVLAPPCALLRLVRRREAEHPRRPRPDLLERALRKAGLPAHRARRPRSRRVGLATGRCLLARHRGAPEGRTRPLAGFVEVGESSRTPCAGRSRRRQAFVSGRCVTRLTAMAVPCRDHAGFRATALADDIHVDGRELWRRAGSPRGSDRVGAKRGAGLGRRDSIAVISLSAGWLSEQESARCRHGLHPPRPVTRSRCGPARAGSMARAIDPDPVARRTSCSGSISTTARNNAVQDRRADPGAADAEARTLGADTRRSAVPPGARRGGLDGGPLLGQPDREPWIGVDWDADPNWQFRTACELEPDELRGRIGKPVSAADRLLPKRPGWTSCRCGPFATTAFLTALGLLHLIEETARHAGHADFLARRSTAQSASSPGTSLLKRILSADRGGTGRFI